MKFKDETTEDIIGSLDGGGSGGDVMVSAGMLEELESIRDKMHCLHLVPPIPRGGCKMVSDV